MSDYPMTKKTATLLRYITKHQSCTFESLQNKFPGIDEMELVNLCLTEYLVCKKPGRLPTDFSRGPWEVQPPDTFWASPKAEEFLENRRRSWLQWVIPTCISAVALIVSAVALIVSLLPKVTEVRLLP